MAFVRRKKMDGNYYYQLVRNYREGGKHRQEVLCHLGVHNTVGAAIEDVRQQLVFHQNEAASRDEEAHRIEAQLKTLYGDEVEILEGDEARDELDRLSRLDPRRSITYYANVYDEREYYMAVEAWEVEKQLVDLCLAYRGAARDAEVRRMRRSQTRKRLDKLLECQRKYCS
jgi:pheromone shutdown protein TraB